jgi:hypothetical protein
MKEHAKVAERLETKMNTKNPGNTSTRYLIITTHHDYRTPRRASIRFIADKLAKRGSLRFFSMRYSALSKSKGGHPRSPAYGNNMEIYGHMPCAETIRFIKPARIGIAPYLSEDVPVYLADRSMKLLQYDFFSLPTICLHSVPGKYSARFGDIPGDAESIKTATRAAMAEPHKRSRQILTWAEATDRLLNPGNYDDPRI